jgi:hypothetical protein
MPRRIAIGCGSAYATDRLDWAVELAESGLVDYLGFDRLAERTMALAQIRRLADESAGQDLFVRQWAEAFVPFLGRGGTMVGNFGAANPSAAGDEVAATLRKADLDGLRVGVIHGDDVLDHVLDQDLELVEMGTTARAIADKIVSANAYIGAEPIVELLEQGARFVLGGRIADPSLFVGPICWEMGWALDDWEKVGLATMVAHILECGTHATGGNYVDPPYRVLDLVHCGFPMAIVEENDVVITKLEGTGGAVDTGTMRTQLAYEVHDPAAYLTPDVAADFSNVWIEEVGPDRVRMGGARGRPRPETLKVLVGVDLGWKVVGEVSHGGPGCVDRARFAADLIRARLEPHGESIDELRTDLIGVDSLFGDRLAGGSPCEVRLRVAARANDRETAEAIAAEADFLWMGPAGSGGVSTSIVPAIGVTPAFVPRDDVKLVTEVIEV